MPIGVMFLFVLVVFFVINDNVYADDYVAPLPPPELGENLTNFKTKQQILESNNIGTVASPTKDKNLIDNRKLGKNSFTRKSKADVQVAMKETSDRRLYVPNLLVPVYTGGESIIVFEVNENSSPLIVANAKVSNSGFVSIVKGNRVIVRPTGYNSASLIKVVIKNHKKPYIFRLAYSTTKHNIRHISNIKIKDIN
ncbi:MAG: hypothetical protein ACI4V7_01790 [Succinivibrionaceae bacterium]